MLPLPFWKAIDRAFFQRAGKLRRRLLGAVVVGVSLGVGTMLTSFQGERDAPTTLFGVCLTGVCVVACVAVVLGLTARDALQRRIYNGESVNPLLRLYFASGWLTMFLWLASAVVVALMASAISAYIEVLGQ